jgi:hypothetical protein
MMTTIDSYTTQCFCGSVKLELTDEPILSGYCHCNDCRQWSGNPLTAWAMWPYEALNIISGETDLLTFDRSDRTPRAWCNKCGGHLGALRDKAATPHFVGLPDLIEGYEFKPAMHVWCKDSVIDVADDLPKYQEGVPTKGDPRSS